MDDVDAGTVTPTTSVKRQRDEARNCATTLRLKNNATYGKCGDTIARLCQSIGAGIWPKTATNRSSTLGTVLICTRSVGEWTSAIVQWVASDHVWSAMVALL